MADNITVMINGQIIEVPPGTLIIEAAKKLGIVIPTFCYDERLRSVGACRMCLVEVEKMPKLVVSCATPVAPNMVVHTETEKVIKARKGVLEFLLINHPLDCPTCDKGGECPLQNLTYSYGPTVSRYKENKIRFIEDINQKFDDAPLGPEIILNRNRCIMCYKCVRIVRELAGEADLGVFSRGAFTNIDSLGEVAYADEFSGNTVEYCPVGALLSKSFRYKVREWLLKQSESICNLCPVGCNISIEWSYGKVFRHMSRRNKDIDDGWLCDRGRYSFDITRAQDRLTKAYIRRGEFLEVVNYDEALPIITKHLRKLINENRGTEVAAVGSSLLSNEEAYAIRRFFENIIKTSNIDFQTDYAKPLEPELIDLIGLDGSIADLQDDSVFIFAGCDPAVEHPVATLRIKKAVSQRGAKAIFIGSYDKRLGYFPIQNIRIPYATEPEVLDFITSQLTGIEISAGSDSQTLLPVIESIKSGSKVHIIAGRGFFNHPFRNKFLMALLNLKKAAGAKLSILAPQTNFIGVSHFGLFGEPEKSFRNILERINTGEVKTLFVFGANPIDEYPDRKYVEDSLKKLEFLTVISPFMHATGQLAHVVLPQAMLPDYGGTFVNIEGRIQIFRPMDERVEIEIKPAWAILGDISDIIGLGQVWHHDSEVRQDMANSLKGMEDLANLPTGGILFPFLNRNQSNPAIDIEQSVDLSRSEYPYILQWTPSVHHTGWLTEKSENLMRISGQQTILINQEDAAKLGIAENQNVEIYNDRGTINLPAKVTHHVNRGELLVINSFSHNSANKLMNQNKPVTSVMLRKV
jgi:NADH-quinone oxidoreductase subunit G